MRASSKKCMWHGVYPTTGRGECLWFIEPSAVINKLNSPHGRSCLDVWIIHDYHLLVSLESTCGVGVGDSCWKTTTVEDSLIEDCLSGNTADDTRRSKNFRTGFAQAGPVLFFFGGGVGVDPALRNIEGSSQAILVIKKGVH